MSARKHPGTDDALARLTAIEAPEFLDRLVLDRALPLLRPHAEPRVTPAPVGVAVRSWSVTTAVPTPAPAKTVASHVVAAGMMRTE